MARSAKSSMGIWFVAALLGVILLLPSSADADAFSEIRTGKTILWGGDQEGGGPYVFPSDNNPTQITGNRKVK